VTQSPYEVKYHSIGYDTSSLTYETNIAQGLLISLAYRSIYSDIIKDEWTSKLRATLKLLYQIVNTAQCRL